MKHTYPKWAVWRALFAFDGRWAVKRYCCSLTMSFCWMRLHFFCAA